MGTGIKTLLKKIFTPELSSDNPLFISNIERYREFDQYTVDIEVFPAQNIHIDSLLPSEPPQGLTYSFGPSGYVGEKASNVCVIPTTWRNPTNYCHWNFTEIPFLLLAFESSANTILLPPDFLKPQLPFQKRWMEVLRNTYPTKKVRSASKVNYDTNTLRPINHDTSTSNALIEKCLYKHYHHSRATPYLIQAIEKYIPLFNDIKKSFKPTERFYINRKNRRLKNELEVQALVAKHGIQVITLEELSLDEQVFLFLNAKLVIGFHGAGLTNLLFSKEATHVLEIVDKDCVSPCYLDGIIISGKKATRTYFHMLSVMKNINYTAIESNDYELNLIEFEKKLQTLIHE